MAPRFPNCKKIDRIRTALQHPDLGAYTLSVQTPNNFTYVRQLPENNLSDYEDRQHIVLNLGYADNLQKSMTIHFNGVKQLKFRSVKLMAVPFNRQYNTRIQQLQKAGLTSQKVTNNSVSGYTDATERTRILTTSIPYSTGWHLKIDGQAGDIFKVNHGFVGARIPVGRHFVSLKYQTPGLALGKLVTAVGIIWWLAFLIGAIGRRIYRRFAK